MHRRWADSAAYARALRRALPPTAASCPREPTHRARHPRRLHVYSASGRMLRTFDAVRGWREARCCLATAATTHALFAAGLQLHACSAPSQPRLVNPLARNTLLMFYTNHRATRAPSWRCSTCPARAATCCCLAAATSRCVAPPPDVMRPSLPPEAAGAAAVTCSCCHLQLHSACNCNQGVLTSSSSPPGRCASSTWSAAQSSPSAATRRACAASRPSTARRC